MYILAATWFSNIFREMFYLLDKVVYNFIPQIYDLLISIARTSVLTQGDISQMADRIYKLLAIFMIFKVTLSLITYIVNPDDFSDKSKGVAKLGTNIIISLALLILTPYVFNYAFRLQTIILEDNSLATLVFGTESNDNFLNTAGQDMSFITMSAFFSPNTSLVELYNCTDLIEVDTKGNRHFNTKCSGLDSSDYEDLGLDDSMRGLVDDKNFTEEDLKDYVRGVEAGSLGLMFRKDMVKATTEDKEYVIDYKYGFSTVVGVVVVLLLVTFCMDVAMRSIKLAFLQLMAPIPIISYVDPKSGKDGLFKKWYQMCFKTFLSLFVRLLALYFAVFIISKVADGKMVDIIDGSYVSNCFISIFIIIGALMFAKQLPKILEGLGIKLDGDGKFFLNPLKKFEEQAAGGKRITGAAGGMVAGAVGGRGFFGRVGSALTGSVRGFNTNKGYKGGLARQADVNRKLREARINGAGFIGSRAAVLSNRYGLDDAGLEREATRLRKDKRAVELARREVDAKTKDKEAVVKSKEDSIATIKKKVAAQKNVQEKISAMEKRAKDEIALGHGGDIGQGYTAKKATYERVKEHGVGQVQTGFREVEVRDSNGNKKIKLDNNGKQMMDANGKPIYETERIAEFRDATQEEMIAGKATHYRAATEQEVQDAENAMNDELESAAYNYISTVVNGGSNDGQFSDGKSDESLKTMYFEYQKAVENAKSVEAEIVDRNDPTNPDSFEVLTTGQDLHKQMGRTKGSVSYIQETDIKPVEDEISDIKDEIRNIQVEQRVKLEGSDEEVSLEKAENDIKVREQKLKDEQEQRKLNRETAKNRHLGGGS